MQLHMRFCLQRACTRLLHHHAGTGIRAHAAWIPNPLLQMSGSSEFTKVWSTRTKSLDGASCTLLSLEHDVRNGEVRERWLYTPPKKTGASDCKEVKKRPASDPHSSDTVPRKKPST